MCFFSQITSDEAVGVPHHLLGTFPASMAGHIDVRNYRDECLILIDKIRKNKRVPILAGGTHYYLESVLWSDFLTERHTTSSKDAEIIASLSLPADSSECYAQLKQINPHAADELHPNNVRKVRRALIEALKQQQSGGPVGRTNPMRDPLIGPLNRSYEPRYPGQTYIFWTDCDADVLNKHLDQRVDDMIKAGLVGELDRFIARIVSDQDTRNDQVITESDKIERLFGNEAKAVTDPFMRRGILQSIGFKEFSDYLALPAASTERTSVTGQQLLNSAIERVKISTRQYARRQIRWITNRFLRRPATGGLPVYRIPVSEILNSDSISDQADWDRLVLAPVVRIVHDHLVQSGDTLLTDCSNISRLNDLLALCPSERAPQPLPFIMKADNESDADSESADGPPFVCPACSGRVFSRLEDWRAHTKSRSHQKRVSKLHKRALLQSVACSDDRPDLCE
ncbi:tRNA dimethylallyltransferase [Fasciola hepatica]|uniref:tRNA dimethylallyltransferase n=1 Tax=Fasciola hepatica TaxID=6192 RepID=A0A4E0RMM7_FASHE|nr:tRNA dimethylallyltransferase [Fasciola hepatica]